MRLAPTPERLAHRHGAEATRAALRRWNAAPGTVLGPWLGGALAIAAGLLAAVILVSAVATPDPMRLVVPGLSGPVVPGDVERVVARNLLVLLLHALACVAGFLAGSAVPLQAAHRQGLGRRVHAVAGPAALAFVGLATAFSLLTQALALGHAAADLGTQLGMGAGAVVLTALPHALPELVALFLPLAAWLHAARRAAWDELLAATVVTSLLALPALGVAAVLEVHLWPDLVRAASPVV